MKDIIAYLCLCFYFFEIIVGVYLDQQVEELFADDALFKFHYKVHFMCVVFGEKGIHIAISYVVFVSVVIVTEGD